MFSNKYLLHFLLLASVLIVSFFCGTASAVSISAMPSKTVVNQPINLTVRSSFRAIVNPCAMQVNPGDGSGWVNITPPCSSSPCLSHIEYEYSKPGRYQVQTRVDASDPDCPVLILPPTTASTSVTITEPEEITLPDGVVGMEYEYELGERVNRYQRIHGRLDTGLKIIRNKLMGIPQREGKYRFQIQSTDSRGTNLKTWYDLLITKARLTVTTTPQKLALDSNRSGSFHLTYHFKSSELLDDMITSTRGIFYAGARQLGTVNTRISTQMTRGTAQLTEQVAVPLNVIKTARRMGVEQIRYQRKFTPKFMDAATTSTTAIAVGTGFTFTKIRITFADHTSKKFVKRNEKIKGAMVEMRYEGAGLLKGYWQVDDRILARVTKNLPFANARTLTLKLPKVPTLPTHSIGSHRLRFVITSPAMNIAFPQVIYIVTGEDLAVRSPIHLISPANKATIASDELVFSWKRKRGVTLYKLELLEKNGKKQKVVFSAFSKETSYTIPSLVIEKKLQPNTSYYWQVTGLDHGNHPVAQSNIAGFTLGSVSQVAVPGRLLMLLDGQSVNKNNILLDSIIKQYGLSLADRKVLPQLNKELFFF